MKDLEKYEAVNKCQTLNDLAQLILDFADENNEIQGKKRNFDAVKMAEFCLNFNWWDVNILTRNWGIRQQAMMIKFYEEYEL